MGILRASRLLRAGRTPGFEARWLWILGLSLPLAVPAHSMEVSLEYQVKAAYLFNFAKFIEWPSEARSGPLTICVAGENPFGDILTETVRGEVVQERSLAARLISNPEPGCHIVFVPQRTDSAAYLQAARSSPTLTVGEAPDFISHGGIINFILEQGKVRFQIDSKAAERAELRISSHLLRLARVPDRRSGQ
jgi:hypothetical protein